MPYDHYIFDVPDTGEALTQINEDGDKINGMLYAADSSQVLLVTEKKPDFAATKKFLGLKDKEDDSVGNRKYKR